MEIKAKLNNLRIAPRKVRLIADMVRGENALAARSLLSFSLKKGAKHMEKLLDSAIANAKNNFNLDDKNLFITKITVDEGTKLKRWRAVSRGRANPIEKKTSRIMIILEEKKGEMKKQKTEKRSKKSGLKVKKERKKENKKNNGKEKDKKGARGNKNKESGKITKTEKKARKTAKAKIKK